MLDESKRQRAMREDVKINMAAVAVIKPFRRQIHPWQVEAARLSGIAAYVRGSQVSRSECLSRAKSLLEEVRQTHGTFKSAIDALPERVARSSRVVDANRAFDTVTAALERAIQLLNDDAALRLDGSPATPHAFSGSRPERRFKRQTIALPELDIGAQPGASKSV